MTTAHAPERIGIAVSAGIAPSAATGSVVVPTAARASWWQRAALAAGVVGLCVLVKALPHAGWPALLARVGPILPLLCGVALGWMAFYARGLRGILGGAVGWGRLFYNRVVGEAYNVVMPFGDVGGDPLRILDLGAEVGTARAVRAIVLDRLTYATSGLLFSALTSLGAVWAFAWDSRVERLLTGYAMVALPAAAVVSLLATRPESGRVVARLLALVKVRVPEVPSALPARVFLRALGWNLLGRAGVMAEVALLLLALGQKVRLDALVAISAMLSVAGMVFFFIPNGIGVNEGATVLALELTGYGKGVGLAVGLARRARQLLLAAAGVAVSALWRPGRPSVVPSVVLSAVPAGPVSVLPPAWAAGTVGVTYTGAVGGRHDVKRGEADDERYPRSRGALVRLHGERLPAGIDRRTIGYGGHGGHGGHGGYGWRRADCGARSVGLRRRRWPARGQ